MFNRTIVCLFGVGLLAGAVFAAEPQILPGANPNPVHLIRPPVQPLSAMARLGRDIFFDTSLSSSGKVACASCHSPDHAYGPPNDGPVVLGGPELTLPGMRAVPSLTYLDRQSELQHWARRQAK
jgi:cytochrome c peroxidase